MTFQNLIIWSCNISPSYFTEIETILDELNKQKGFLHWFFGKSNIYAILEWEMMMMMINCFRGMVDQRKAFSLISSRDHCQRSSPSQISDTPRAGFEPAKNLSLGLVEWSCVVVITTTPHTIIKLIYNQILSNIIATIIKL